MATRSSPSVVSCVLFAAVGFAAGCAPGRGPTLELLPAPIAPPNFGDAPSHETGGPSGMQGGSSTAPASAPPPEATGPGGASAAGGSRLGAVGSAVGGAIGVGATAVVVGSAIANGAITCQPNTDAPATPGHVNLCGDARPAAAATTTLR